MKRIRLKVGDIFRVPIEGMGDRYFQYIGDDSTQLHSNVIRVFKNFYPFGSLINLEEIAQSEIEFHTHCVVKFGYSIFTLWERVGNSEIKASSDPVFRDTNDSGQPDVITKTKKWYTWQMNQEFRKVKDLSKDLENSELGLVFNPYTILHRLKTGEYDFVYPTIDWD